MSQVAGIVLALGLLAVYAWALTQIWRAPFRALGVLVAGMAFHNILIMLLLHFGVPSIVVRMVQAWKEGILLLLLALAIAALVRAVRERRLPRPTALDLAMVALAVLAVIYTVLPPSLLHGSANTQQRVLGLRVLLLLPALYLFGRVFQPRGRSDLHWVAWVITGAGAAVGLFGLVELWFVPTTAWLDWGVNQLSNWLGFTYNGPRGLPANFFQTTAEGFLLRRMVSTYVSPLGIAYAGLVIIPVAAALLLTVKGRRERWLAWTATLLIVSGVLFSLTRLALVMMVAEFLILAILTRRRSLLYLTPVVALASIFMIFQYVDLGPLLLRNLGSVPHRPAHLHIVGSTDPSLREHAGLLSYDLRYVMEHPLGTGVGSSVHRFGPSQGTGESAVLDMFGDLGLLGGLLYLAIYTGSFVMALLAYLRHRADPLLAMLPLTFVVAAAGLAPVSISTDLWSDFATTFLFWWAAGASITLLTQPRRPVSSS
jgi:hypothetical protein